MLYVLPLPYHHRFSPNRQAHKQAPHRLLTLDFCGDLFRRLWLPTSAHFSARSSARSVSIAFYLLLSVNWSESQDTGGWKGRWIALLLAALLLKVYFGPMSPSSRSLTPLFGLLSA